MLISNTNYNTLGKIGPHYERPEYRPTEQAPADQNQSTANERARGDRQTLSIKNTDAPVKKAAAVSNAKLGLDGARDLVGQTVGLISALPPQSTDREPHLSLPSSLMSAIYV